jgi:hypothetical protein
MADFTELLVYKGVGDWHFNRFRIAFEPSKVDSVQTLFTKLLVNFPSYINSSYATAQWGHVMHDGRRTIHFQGYAKVLGINLAAPHSDWVAIEGLDPTSVGFTVQTLKREFLDVKEDGATTGLGAAIAFVPGIGTAIGLIGGAVLGGTAGAHYNRMHFLAGRRSWRIDRGSLFGLSNDVTVLETVAVERFSSQTFNIADAVIGLEKRVPDVWFAFLDNFVNQMHLKPVDQVLRPRWKKGTRAVRIGLSFSNQAGLMADPEFQDANSYYPLLLPSR